MSMKYNISKCFQLTARNAITFFRMHFNFSFTRQIQVCLVRWFMVYYITFNHPRLMSPQKSSATSERSQLIYIAVWILFSQNVYMNIIDNFFLTPHLCVLWIWNTFSRMFEWTLLQKWWMFEMRLWGVSGWNRTNFLQEMPFGKYHAWEGITISWRMLCITSTFKQW